MKTKKLKFTVVMVAFLIGSFLACEKMDNLEPTPNGSNNVAKSVDEIEKNEESKSNSTSGNSNSSNGKTFQKSKMKM